MYIYCIAINMLLRKFPNSDLLMQCPNTYSLKDLLFKISGLWQFEIYSVLNRLKDKIIKYCSILCLSFIS